MDTSQNVPDSDICVLNSLVSDSSESSGPDSDQIPVSGSRPQPTDLWELVKAELARSLAPSVFKVWIKPLQAKCQDQTVIVEVPNQFFLKWVQEHYESKILALFARECQKNGCEEISFELVLPPPPTSPPPAPAPQETGIVRSVPAQRTIWQTQGPLRINPDFTFKNFVPGNPNRLAFEAAQAFARGENLGTDILFFNADHGLGKSHLVQALAQKSLAQNPELNIYYLSAEEFTSEMVCSLKNQQMDDFKLKYRKDCDILMLEEVCFLAGKPKIQEEFNYTLELLLNHGKKIVLTSTKEPKFLGKGLSEQLKSKMNSALLARINPPDFETRLAILHRKADKTGLKLDRQILEFIADNIQNDVRLLEGCLVTLSAKSRFLNQPVSLEMARECLSFVQDTADDDLSAGKIIQLVCLNYHLGESEITSVSRRRQLNEARAMGMFLLRTLTSKTLEEIGACFHRSHSTTLYTIKQVESRLKKDSKLKELVNYLTNQLVQG